MHRGIWYFGKEWYNIWGLRKKNYVCHAVDYLELALQLPKFHWRRAVIRRQVLLSRPLDYYTTSKDGFTILFYTTDPYCLYKRVFANSNRLPQWNILARASAKHSSPKLTFELTYIIKYVVSLGIGIDQTFIKIESLWWTLKCVWRSAENASQSLHDVNCQVNCSERLQGRVIYQGKPDGL